MYFGSIFVAPLTIVLPNKNSLMNNIISDLIICYKHMII